MDHKIQIYQIKIQTKEYSKNNNILKIKYNLQSQSRIIKLIISNNKCKRFNIQVEVEYKVI